MTGPDRVEIAKRFGLPEQLAERLEGASAEEVEADAQALAKAMSIGPQSIRERARRHLAEMFDGNPNTGELLAFALRDENKAQLGRLVVGDVDEEPEQEPDGPPSFDGGAREMAPPPSDPDADHNAAIADLFAGLPRRGTGTGGEEW